MRVFLLPTRDGSGRLHSPDLPEREPEPPGPDASAGARWLSRARGAYRWLTSGRRRREALVRTLGDVERIRIAFPSSWSEARARETYDTLLRDTVEKHRRWMWWNAAALPASLPLGLIPGPNLLLGYLALRSAAHYRAKKAGERAIGLEVAFRPEPLLAQLEDLLTVRTSFRRAERIRRLGEELGIERLDALYSWTLSS